MCQSNSTRSDVLENAGEMRCVGCTVMCQSNLTRPDVLEMLGKCGVFGVQKCASPVQLDLTCWKC